MISTANIKDYETKRVLDRMALVVKLNLSSRSIPSTLNIADPEVRRALDVLKQDMCTGSRKSSGASNIKDPEVRRVIESINKNIGKLP